MINQNLSTLLTDKICLDIKGIDRLYLNVYQPLLQLGGGVCHFFRQHRGKPVASTVLMRDMIRQSVNDIQAFIRDHDVELESLKRVSDGGGIRWCRPCARFTGWWPSR